jgi:hypothetical protein
VSAVIYAAIVVIWLIVLVPMWLRRHDAATDERSSERFEGAMRVLARRPAAVGVDRRYVVMPRRSAATAVHVSGAVEPARTRRGERQPLTASLTVEQPAAAARPKSTRPESARPVSPRPTKRPVSLAARRRRTLLALAVLSVLSIVAAVVGVLPALVQLVPELLLIGFVVHLRMQARQAAVVSRQIRRDATAPQAAAPQGAASQRAVRRPAAAPAPTWVSAPARVVASPTSASPYDHAEALADEAPEPLAAGGGDTWEPRPWPAPTYTMKPAAPRVSLGRERGPSEEIELDGVADEGDLDVILEPVYDQTFEPRRAVND